MKPLRTILSLILLCQCAGPGPTKDTATISNPVGLANISGKAIALSGMPAYPAAVGGKPFPSPNARMWTEVRLPIGKQIVRCQCIDPASGVVVAGDVTLNVQPGHRYQTRFRVIEGRVKFHIEDASNLGVPLATGSAGAEPILDAMPRALLHPSNHEFVTQMAVTGALMMR